jgi:hypothetical protein
VTSITGADEVEKDKEKIEIQLALLKRRGIMTQIK